MNFLVAISRRNLWFSHHREIKSFEVEESDTDKHLSAHAKAFNNTMKISPQLAETSYTLQMLKQKRIHPYRSNVGKKKITKKWTKV